MALFVILPLFVAFVSCHPNNSELKEVCAAYFDVTHAVPVQGHEGAVWEASICRQHHESQFIACSYFDGIFSADLRSCPEGHAFNREKQGQASLNVKDCVSAEQSDRKECPSWRDLAAKKAAASRPRLTRQSTEGSHSCIDCEIGECHYCLCREALKKTGSIATTVLEPFNKKRNQYLVCEGHRLTCHPCPEGLVWDCRKQVCAHDGECPDIPKPCRCDCDIIDRFTKTITTETTATLTTVVTTAVTVTIKTVTLNSSDVAVSAPSTTSYVKKYTTETTTVCTTTSVAPGGEVSVPCNSTEPTSSTSVEKHISTNTTTIPSPSSNTTTIRTNDPCSDTTATTTTTACNSTCPPMTTTITVRPSPVATAARARRRAVCPSSSSSDPTVSNLSMGDSATPIQRCLCVEALKTTTTTTDRSAYLCDPHAQDGFLACQKDGKIASETCAHGTKWNHEIGACSKTRKCLPTPPACAKLFL